MQIPSCGRRSSTQTVAKLTFFGVLSEGANSLVDGNYTLTVFCGQVAVLHAVHNGPQKLGPQESAMVIVVKILPPAPLIKGAPLPPPMVHRYDLGFQNWWLGLDPLINPGLSQGYLDENRPAWAFGLPIRLPYSPSLYFSVASLFSHTTFMGLAGLRLVQTNFGPKVTVTPGTVGGEGWYYNRFLNPQAELAVYPLQWSVGYIPRKQPVSLVRRY
jgi:hypothetical protein